MDKKLVIIASGKSLSSHVERGDFELLKKVDTIAMNKFDWFIDEHGLDFLPTRYCWFEQNDGAELKERIIRVFEHFVKPMRTQCYFVNTLHRHMVEQWMVTDIEGCPEKLIPRNFQTISSHVQFVIRCNRLHHGGQLDENSPDGWHLPMLCCYGGSMIAVTQLAYMLGYQKVGIIGADLGYTDPVHHFHEDYKTILDSHLTLEKQDDTLRNVHAWALDYFQTYRRGYYNLGIGGKLDVLPRENLIDFVESL